MNAMKRRMLAIQAAVLAVCAIIVTMTCPAALAAEQLLRANGKHYEYFLDGKPYVIGVNAESKSGKFYYCRQIESVTDYKVTETTTVENTEAARRLAWLLSEYQHDGEPVLALYRRGVLVLRIDQVGIGVCLGRLGRAERQTSHTGCGGHQCRQCGLDHTYVRHM